MKQQQQATVLLMTIALAFAVAVVAGSPMRSRFLAGFGPRDKKCNTDPLACYGPNSKGSTCCGDTCANLQSDWLNCGKCSKVCKFMESCCDGKCVDLNDDKNHCGSCFVGCSNQCVHGMCNYA